MSTSDREVQFPAVMRTREVAKIEEVEVFLLDKNQPQGFHFALRSLQWMPLVMGFGK
jgi:hypothetical protein